MASRAGAQDASIRQTTHDPPERVRPRRRPQGSSWLIADVATLAAAALAAAALAPTGLLATQPVWVALFVAVTIGRLAARRMYTARSLDRAVSSVVDAVAVATMISLSARLLAGSEIHAVSDTLWLAGLSAGLLSAERLAISDLRRQALRRGVAGRRALIVGAGRIGRLTAARLLERPELGMRPVGFLDKEPLPSPHGPHLPVLGASWDIEQVLEDYGIDAVVVTFSTAPDEVLLRLVRRCRARGVDVAVVPRLFEVEGERVEVRHVGALPLVTVDERPPTGWRRVVKEVTDRAVAAVLLVVLLPVLAAIALAIRMAMGAPIFHAARRVGRGGHTFEMVKFRTMSGEPGRDGESDVAWAAAMRASVHPFAAAGGMSANGGAATTERPSAVAPVPHPTGGARTAADNRTTRLGRFLRRNSLDELPQLWNVLRGDMSLVGPRPERVGYVRDFAPSVYRYGDRHRVKPGLTGWAQVNGLRGQTSLSERVEWDNFYIENWSIRFDFEILLATAGAMLRARRAA